MVKVVLAVLAETVVAAVQAVKVEMTNTLVTVILAMAVKATISLTVGLVITIQTTLHVIITVVIFGRDIPVIMLYILVTSEHFTVEDLGDLEDLLVEPVGLVELEV